MVWRVIKIRPQPPDVPPLACGVGTSAVEVTLEDVGGAGLPITLAKCKSITDIDPCTFLNSLAALGYEPNDWTAGCGG